MQALLLAALLVPVAQARSLAVAVTTTDLAAVAREVGGEHARVAPLADGRQNPHFVDARPSLIIKLMKTDAFAVIGLELETAWAGMLVVGSRNNRIQLGAPGFIDASLAISPKQIPERADRALGDVHAGGNPHYLLDPDNAKKVAAHLAERFGELEPEHAAAYAANAGLFAARVDAAAAKWRARLAPFAGARAASYHRNWIYFTDYFGLREGGEIEPKPGIPPTGKHTQALIERMRAEKTRLIFTSPWFEERTPSRIAAATGARVVPLALTPGARARTDDYFAWMDYNVRVVAEALDGAD